MTPLAHICGESCAAVKYGLEEAVFLDAIMFWYRTNRGNAKPVHFHDGRWWTYNSVKTFEDVFPWWNAGQIRRIIARCKDKGALLVGNYNKDQRDRTAWYTPSDELLELCGEEKCNCRKQQMEDPAPSTECDENGEALPCNTHVDNNTDPPYSPPKGDKPAAKPKQVKSAPVHDPEAFETFWTAYPRKDDRRKAIRAWDKLKPDKPLCRVMYTALLRQKASAQWTRDGGQYIPMFPTWLNGRRWEDQGVDLSQLPRPRAESVPGVLVYDPEVTR